MLLLKSKFQRVVFYIENTSSNKVMLIISDMIINFVTLQLSITLLHDRNSNYVDTIKKKKIICTEYGFCVPNIRRGI